MKREKIKERFPYTLPKIAATNPEFPIWLLKRLIPKPGHWSGTTPRWAEMVRVPTVTHAVLFKSETKEALAVGVYTLGESQASNVCGYFTDGENAKAAQREFIREFWNFQSSRLAMCLAEICKKHGGFLL